MTASRENAKDAVRDGLRNTASAIAAASRRIAVRRTERHVFWRRKEPIIMSNEMVKRVAIAICEASAGVLGTNPTLDWRSYERQARAAIEAMRQPTEEMIFRGGLVKDAPWDGKKPARILSAMVDAALQDKAWQKEDAP
ncbi:MAG: hypothetical protein P0Y66_19970 [Candidatus Kaistia colombiensis]|nr:MAG: hypothetical protein P0Y66_19970 [Kaistia sp.]